MLDEKTLALLGDREAQEAITARGELLPCPGCKTRFGVAIRCTDTKAEIVCQHKFCGFRVIKTSKEGAAIALLRARKAWNTRAPLLTPTQMAVLGIARGGREDLGGEQVKVYIAGKITGDPNYQKKFQWAQEDLEGQGFTVLNPAELPEGMRPADYMRICMAMMDSADIVAFLPDYEQSRGAQLEWAWCQYVGKQTMYLESMTFYRPYPKTERKKGDEFPW